MPVTRSAAKTSTTVARRGAKGGNGDDAPPPAPAELVAAEPVYATDADKMQEEFPDTPLLITVGTLLGYGILFVIGQIREFLLLRLGITPRGVVFPRETPKNKGFVPLYKDFESFYTRNMYRRIRDCWNRPINSLPGLPQTNNK